MLISRWRTTSQDNRSRIRGFQLHVGVSGGSRGTLELVDISINNSPSFVFFGLEYWEAFNVQLAQMTAGLDDPGISTATDTDGVIGFNGYLATFTYRASDDAEGTFFVDLLHDASDEEQRTFLFPTPSTGTIDIQFAQPATVTVAPGG